ncbi:MAG: glycosyltransferase [Mitsuokella multacida]|jgi:glycosyltransferase involved in cell wall biosynthesis
MKNPLISVVVPIYNVEKYLDHCVTSIINQTYKDFELILVDDGSPDNCPALCDQYVAAFPQVKVLHKSNGGLSDARNAGMEMAKGDYITFIDSDDYIHPLYLELLLKGIQQTGADFSLIGFEQVYNTNAAHDIEKDAVLIEKYDAEDALCQVLYQKFHDVSASGILLPLTLAKKFKFPVKRKFEDLFTTYQYFLSADSVAFVNISAYYYLQRNGSIRGGRDDRTQMDMIEASNNLVRACAFNKSLKNAAISKRFNNFRFLLSLDLSGFKKRNPDVYNQIIHTIEKDKWTILTDQEARIENKAAALSLFFGVWGLRALYKLKRSGGK